MNALERLKNKLHNVNRMAVSRMQPSDTLPLRDEQAELEKWINGDVQRELMTRDAVENAIESFRQSKRLENVSQIRMICYGCAKNFEGRALVENVELFEKLLAGVEAHQVHSVTFRKFYRGLLISYFAYDPDDASSTGRRGWMQLRTFLKNHLGTLPLGGYVPVWHTTLLQHANLLGENPCQPYEGLVLAGDWSVFGDIRERLEIGADSWLVRQMVLSPIMAASRLDDAAFKECLHTILHLLNEYSLYAFAGLKILLDRYALCLVCSPDETLKNFAIEYWGNPWLPADAHQWLCSASARKMVAHWHMRYLLDEFFSVLSGDGRIYPRRWEFWDVYSADMTGLYFALGKEVFVSGSVALANFRRNAKGLIVGLAEENVHACVMQFKHSHVIEFNRTNSSACFYDTRKGIPSFYLSRGWVEMGVIDEAELNSGNRAANVPMQLRHQDAEEMTWEGIFAEELGVTENAIIAFCQKYQCLYEDRRSQNKGRWIRPLKPYQYGPEVWSVLYGWGFEGDESSYFFMAGDWFAEHD